MTGVNLLIFAAAMSMVAPRWLSRAGWAYRAPRLGIAAWYAVLAAVTMAVAGAVMALVLPWPTTDPPICLALRWCVQAAGGRFGVPGRALVGVVVLLAGALAARLLVTGVVLVRSAAIRRRAHRRLLAVAGRPSPDWGATIVANPQPAAYVVAGFGRRVVVTTGAVEQLADDELAAVLAHERAHALGRHDLLLDGVRLLAQAFPRMALFAVARVQLCRLVEIRADEVATRRHARLSLARALVTMACANASTGAAPAGAVGATGGDAAERLHRLLNPPAPLRRAHAAALAASLAALTIAPVGIVIAARVFPILGMCVATPV